MALGDDRLSITGELRAGNMARGKVTVEPVANTPTAVSITGLDLANNGGEIVGLAFNETAVPGSTVIETTVDDLSYDGMDVVLYRTNTTTTLVAWHMFTD